jgi:hypothetical protein
MDLKRIPNMGVTTIGIQMTVLAINPVIKHGGFERRL